MTAPVSPPQPTAEPVRHTPTPWNCASRYSSVVGVSIVNQQGRRIGNTALPDMPPEWDDMKRQAEVDAAFICEAVNSHVSLKARAEQAEQAVDVLESNARVQAKLLADTGRRVEELETALLDLVSKLEIIHDNPRFQAVWECAHFRLGPYDGPKYEQELIEAKAVLAALAPSTPAVSR